jgi:hypothetical protein
MPPSVAWCQDNGWSWPSDCITLISFGCAAPLFLLLLGLPRACGLRGLPLRSTLLPLRRRVHAVKLVVSALLFAVYAALLTRHLIADTAAWKGEVVVYGSANSAAWLLSTTLVRMEYRRGVVQSLALRGFWLLSAVLTCITFLGGYDHASTVSRVTDALIFGLLVFMASMCLCPLDVPPCR